MAASRGIFSLSRFSGVLRSQVRSPSLRRLQSTEAEEELRKVSKGTWKTVAKLLLLPTVAGLIYKYDIQPALEEGVPEGVHVFTWLIARCLMMDRREEDRLMDEHLMRMRDYADDYLVANEAKFSEKYPMVSGRVQEAAKEFVDRSEEVGPDGY